MAKGNKNAFLEVPYHLSYLKMDEDDERRHRSRCRHYIEKNSCEYYSRCIGSSHCTYYKEKEFKDLENNIEEIKIKEKPKNKTSKKSKKKAEKNLYNITAGRMINTYRENKEENSKVKQITLEEIKIKNNKEKAKKTKNLHK